MKKGKLRPAMVFHPGVFIHELRTERGWTQAKLAAIIGRPLQVINDLERGRRDVSVETAIQIGAAFDQSPQYWLNLQTAYALWHAEKKVDVHAIEARSKAAM